MLPHLILIADSATAENIINSVVSPLMTTLSIVGGLVCVLIIIYAGFQYITSSGDPIKLLNSKKIIKECIVGIVLIFAAAIITTILKHAYGTQPNITTQQLPSLSAVKPQSTSLGLVGVLIDAITGVLQDVIQSIGKPFISALNFFTSGTPLLASNSSVF